MKYEWLDAFLLSMPKATKDYKVEWEWTRYQIGGKLFAAICKAATGERDLLTLKLDPMDGDFLRSQYEDIIPGYYMNKVHWNSIYLDGIITDELMQEMIEKSYKIVFNSLSKKVQRELLGENESLFV